MARKNAPLDIKGAQLPDIPTHVAMEREKIGRLCKHAHSEATKFTEKLVKEATKRQKAIYKDTCNTLECLVQNKAIAEEAVARGMKALNKALAHEEQQAKLALEHRKKQLQEIETAKCASLRTPPK